MSIQSTCKSAAIIVLAVVALGTLLAAGAMLFVFGASLAAIFFGVVIAVAIVMAVLEEISAWYKRRFPKSKARPAQQ